MKKRVLSALLCGALAAALLAGCGSSSSTSSTTTADDTSAAAEAADTEEAAEGAFALDGTWPEETVLIGVEIYDTTDDQTLAFEEYLEYLSDYFNISFMYSESIANAEAELEFIDSCASAGASAIISYYNVSGAEAIQRTIDQGMYYWGTEQYADEFADEEMYLGSRTHVADSSSEGGDYLAGYEMAYALAEQGCTHVFYCNGGASFGVEMFMDRQEGFIDGIAAAQADGYDIVFNADEDTIEGWPGTDDFTAAVGIKLAGDYDGACVSFSAASLFQPIADAGKSDSIKVASLGGVNDTFYDVAMSGELSVLIYECPEVIYSSSVLQILNAVSGHIEATRPESGEAGLMLTYKWVVDSPEAYETIYDYHESGNYFFTAYDMAQFIVEYNADATFEDAYAYYSSLDMETALASME